MEPIGVETKGGAYDIIHRCVKCGIVKRNKAAAEDDFDVLLQIAARQGGPA
jgi:hypothetical protein